jgi:hypothetical protein
LRINGFALRGFARHQRRAWIETMMKLRLSASASASPVTNDGRGLKLHEVLRHLCVFKASPVTNDGRGLKQPEAYSLRYKTMLRPSPTTGVD